MCNKRKVYWLYCFVVLVLLLSACQIQKKDVTIDTIANVVTTSSPSLAVEAWNQFEEITASPEPTIVPTPEPTPKNVTLLAVGDNLIHEEVIDSGVQQGRDYNYDHLFAQLAEQISSADISVINQETILGGKELGYSGYPTFNSPTQIGDAIAKAGFDVVLQASNHAMDKGKKGIENTLEFWKKYPNISVLGIHQSVKDQRSITIVKKNGIKIAVLNATYGLNGITLSSDESFRVDILEKNWMKEQIKKSKEEADVVVVFAHWGTEYIYEPDEVQKKWTDFFADQGVDLVIGSHPHVIQPVQWVEGKQGNKMLVYYSLGNYISYQKKAPRMLGGMAEVTFTKTEDGVEITDAAITPIVTHYEQKSDYRFATYLLSDYTQELASKHGVIEKEENSLFSLEYMKELSNKVLGDWKRISIK